MKILLILVITSVVMAAEVAAQPGGQPVIAVSAIDKVSPQIQPLAGTLFFDPLERDRMDRARKSGLIGIDPAAAAMAPSVINGYVKRGDGITTVWVDGAYQQVTSAKHVARINSSSVGMAVKITDSADNTVTASAKQQAHTKASSKTRQTKRKLKLHNSNSRK